MMTNKTTKKKKSLSIREAFKLNFRAIRLICRADPRLILSQTLASTWKSITPYVGIYLSARIIGELAGARDPRRLQYLVLLTLGSTVIIALISALLARWQYTVQSNRLYKTLMIFSEKYLSMDYADLQAPRTLEIRSQIEQMRTGGGWGITKITFQLEQLATHFFSLLAGLSLTITLFTHSVPASAGVYTLLNHPLAILLIVAVMLLVTILTPAFSVKASKYMAQGNNTHNFGNRLFGFYGYAITDKRHAPDARIYRYDRIASIHNNNKHAVFHSRGYFAKLARGPMGLYKTAASAVSVVFTAITYLFVCLKAWAGAFGVGEVTQYVASITKVFSGFSGLLSILGEMRTNAEFLAIEFEFLDIPNSMYQGSLTVEKRLDRDYEIEFRNVSFKYPGAENYSLRNVSMKFNIGQRLAVVGQNGSGKTTFIKLLCRLYDPTEGEILLNNIDIRKYNYPDYLSIFSIVFQDFRLFAFTLGENIAGTLRYDEAKVTDALIKAGFGDRLKEMPKGLGTYLYKNFDQEGVDLSGGEAQKIALARTIYKDAPFIILDEPTAALDPIAEAEVYSKFNDIIEDKTAIYISHRLSSCKFCDEIAVFDNGQIVQQGTHAELLKEETGKYHELWYAQAQYYTTTQTENASAEVTP